MKGQRVKVDALSQRVTEAMTTVINDDLTLSAMSADDQWNLLCNDRSVGPQFLADRVHCPKCNALVLDVDVTMGFNKIDRADFTTLCPTCDNRFICTGTAVGQRFTWLGPLQTSSALDTWTPDFAIYTDGEDLFDDLMDVCPSLAWNLALHKGRDVLTYLTNYLASREKSK